VTGGGSKQAKGAMKQGSRHDKLRDEVQNGEKCEVSVFRYYGTQSRAASNRRTVNSKSSLPELAHLLSARLPVGPAAFLIRKKWREMRNVPISLLWYLVGRQAAGEQSTASQVCQS